MQKEKFTKEKAKEILLKFAEDNKWKSDGFGFLSGIISTYFGEEEEDDWYEAEGISGIEPWFIDNGFGKYLQADGLDGDIYVKVDGKLHKLFIDHFDIEDIAKNIRTYHCHYYEDEINHFKAISYSFSNQDKENLLKVVVSNDGRYMYKKL